MFFELLKQSKKSRARLGVLHTPHGDVETPSFVPVATKGTLKAIPPRDFKELGMQVAFVNTFHLALHPGANILKKFGGIHKYAGFGIPLMSDSAGFQVFSLGGKKKMKARNSEDEAIVLKISEEGVSFRSPDSGKEMFFSPESSIKAQEAIGADIIMAFDECIYAGASHEYAKEATERTHQWLLRCMKTKKRKDQALYGIVQGGAWKDLRVASSQFVGKQNVEGIAIGGVAIGETKKEIKDQVQWAMPHVPNELPRHLLGMGRLEDFEYFVKQGIDTFDCVEPTRLARNGIVFRQAGDRFLRIDLAKSKYRNDKNPIQKDCACHACRNFSLSYIHHVYKERELLGYYLATTHNLFLFNRVFFHIRLKIKKGLL